jgi:hypothetical protein
MARCPDVQLRPLSRLKHYVENLVMAKIASKCIRNASSAYRLQADGLSERSI